MRQRNCLRARCVRALPVSVLTLMLALPQAFVAQPQPQQSSQPQQPAQKQNPPPGGMGGVTTGEARTYTSRRTVGIFDDKAPTVFEDVTAKTALARFKNRSGGLDKNYIIEATAAGAAVFDYDNDGLLDIYLLNGSTFEALRGKEKPPRAALYRNLGNWKFEDVTDRAGLANERWGMGVAAGDFDNDGWADLYVGNYGLSRLYRNNGNGTFTDLAEKLGVARKGWSTGASFGDYDGDGRLDIFVPGYLEFDIDNPPPSPAEVGKPSGVSKTFCQFRGVPVMCGPRGLKGETDTLYHQKADGSFEEVSQKTGTHDPERFYGFSSVFAHINDDALLDLLVVNDSTPKLLYINKGNGTFEETGYPSGVALSENGREQAGMGLGVGDYDNDGLIDFYITNFSDDYNTMLHNDGEGYFSDVSFQVGVGDLTLPFLGWGTSFLDYDNDGWKDLLVANGHVYPGVDKYQWGTSYAQQPLLLRNLATGKFARVGAAPASGLALALPARGLAIGDLDGDGQLDAVFNNMDAAPTVLRNVTRPAGHWLGLKLVGDPARKSPKDAIGAMVYVTTGKLRQRQDVVSGAGYASQNDQRLHFGLGAATRVDKVEIQWPGGGRETVTLPGCDRVFTILEGKGIVSP